jgi:hypothetical protein
MLRKIGAPIDTLVVYRSDQPYPQLHAFRWGGRRYNVSATHLVHTERIGERVILCYAVSSGGDHFHLRLDTPRGRWTLHEIEVDA